MIANQVCRPYDPKLLEYCDTPHQRKIYEAYGKHGTVNETARKMGKNSSSVSQAVRAIQKKANAAGYTPQGDQSGVAAVKSYYLTLKVQNNYLKKRMGEAGIGNASRLAAACDVAPSDIGKMLNLQMTPYTNTGTGVRAAVERVCAFLGCGPEDIFPPEHIEAALPAHVFTAEHDFVENRLGVGAVDPLLLLEADEERGGVYDFMSCLSARERKVIDMRFGLGDCDQSTLKDVASEYGVSVGRIRQIGVEALRKMRRVARATQ